MMHCWKGLLVALLPTRRAKGVEQCCASRRQSVTRAKALSQTKALQLSNIEFELLLFLTSQFAQVSCADSCMGAYDVEDTNGPRPPSVQSVQPAQNLSELHLIRRGCLSERDSWIGTRRAKFDTVYLTLRSEVEFRQRRLQRFVTGPVCVCLRDLIEFDRRDCPNVDLANRR